MSCQHKLTVGLGSIVALLRAIPLREITGGLAAEVTNAGQPVICRVAEIAGSVDNAQRKCADTTCTVPVPRGWPFQMPKQQYIFQIKYTQAIILSNSTRKLLLDL